MNQNHKNLARDDRTSDPILTSEMRRTANDLIQVATPAFMKMHGVDRKTAQRWIMGAIVTAAKWKTPKSRQVCYFRPTNLGESNGKRRGMYNSTKGSIENEELADKAIVCPSCDGKARTFKHATRTGPATRSWHVCYAEIRWRSVQRTKRWKETWKGYGGRLRPTCFVRERISRALLRRWSQPGCLGQPEVPDGHHCRGD
jgi:hypothetical protein